jgi:hypothetical protein
MPLRTEIISLKDRFIHITIIIGEFNRLGDNFCLKNNIKKCIRVVF